MFLNREEAGIRLAFRLSQLKGLKNPVTVVIPRGGVVVGKVISKILGIPLTALVVKKIGAPGNPELALGAVGNSKDSAYWDERILQALKIEQNERERLLEATVNRVVALEKSLGVRPLIVRGRNVFVVDDGVATGATSVAAGRILKNMGAAVVILATPVISKTTKKELVNEFDKIISITTPADFTAVGGFYKDFPQVEDDVARELLSNK